jgi:hypothetical protein
MLYLFLSFVFCGVAVACFEHGRSLAGLTFMVLSCFMPVIKDTLDKLEPAPAPAPIIIEPDPAVEAQFNAILKRLDEIDERLKSCVELSTALLQPAQ